MYAKCGLSAHQIDRPMITAATLRQPHEYKGPSLLLLKIFVLPVGHQIYCIDGCLLKLFSYLSKQNS